MKTNKIILLLFVIINTFSVKAQFRLTGNICDTEKQSLSGIVVSLQQDTTLIGATLTDSFGNYIFENLKSGTYQLISTAIGFDMKKTTLHIKANTKQNVIMETSGIQLEEVNVIADKSHIVISNATGTTFHLSNRAKTLRDPFEALLEIPKLSVIPSSRKVTLSDGTVPLILINGNRLNGGVESLDPKQVESIEIIETPSARYLKDGVQAIVNFKTKRQEIPYQKLNIGTSHSIPIFYGISNAYYEIGKKNTSLSLSAQHWYFHNDNATISNTQQNVGYFKWRESERNWKAQNIYIDLNADWICSSKDYLAFKMTYINNPSKYISEGMGELTDESKDLQNFTFYNKDRVAYYINTYNLYYKHTFHKKSWLEATARFNINGNQTEGIRREDYPSWEYNNSYDFDNSRNSGGMEINYITPLGKHTLNIGNETSFLKDRIQQTHDGHSTFQHRNIDEYIFVGLNGKFNQKLSYALSAGYEILFRRVAGIDYDYNKPAGNISLNWRMNPSHSIGVSYNLRHITPNVSQLNPYNTSTDSLMVQQGNPFLLPSQSQQWRLRYSYNKHGLYIEPSVSYTLVTDAVEQIGTTNKSTDIYISTFENSDRYSYLSGSMNMRYNNSQWGGFSLGVENITRFYKGQSGKNLFKYNLNFYGWHKRFSWDGYLWYTPIDYNVHAKIKNYGAESEFRLTYKINQSLSVSTGMRYLLGTLKTNIYQTEDTYSSVNKTSMNDRRWKILFGISYSWKKEKSPNRQKKYLETTESGIKL